MIDPAGSPTLSRSEAAAYLGLRVSTLENWASTGKYGLPFVKIGRRVRYLKTDLDAFIQRRRRTWPVDELAPHHARQPARVAID